MRLKKYHAVEKLIIKIRALEHVLYLYEFEHLKHFIEGSVRASVQARVGYHNSRNWMEMLPSGKTHFDRCCKLLKNEAIIFADDLNKIRELVNYRNDIAHEIQHVTLDIIKQHKWGRWKEISDLREAIAWRMFQRQRYIFSSTTHGFFENASHALVEEIERMKSRARKIHAKNPRRIRLD